MSPPSDATTDDLLWSRARRGDPAAFGELFTRHSKVVYNYCFRLTGSWSTAEDLTSVVFLEAWRRRGEGSIQNGGFVPWLLGVASNVAHNSTRAVRRHRRLLAELPQAVIEGDASDDGKDAGSENGESGDGESADDGTGNSGDPDRAHAERQMKQILRVFRRLPKREQEVLALCVWGERSYAEAAVALGIPVGTVRSRLARARAHMQRLTESAAARAAAPRPGSTPEEAHRT